MDATQKLLDDLRSGLGGSEVELRREESVGPKIGGELRTAAMNSVVAALALIVLYITVRFVFRYGIAAILALVHDVTLTLGVFSLLDLEISLQIIAAFLTIIGYSLNDTIVVFDRIRENMKLRRKESYRDVINRSINETPQPHDPDLADHVLRGGDAVPGGRTGDPRLRVRADASAWWSVRTVRSSSPVPILVWWYERRIADKKRMAMDM